MPEFFQPFFERHHAGWTRLPGSARERLTAVITIAASVGLALVLLCSMAFAFYAANATSAAATRSKTAQSLNALYASARVSVTEEESLVRKYRLKPGIGVARALEVAAYDLVTALNAIERQAAPVKAAEARRLLELHSAYRSAAHLLFAAVDAGDAGRVPSLEDSMDADFAVIHDAVYARSVEENRLAANAFTTLEVTQRNVVCVAIALSVAGLGCLLGFLSVIYGYRERMLASHAAELLRIEEATLIDSLTRIGNHRAFQEDIRREIALAVRHEVPLTLATFDIDEFKQVNDQNGHVHGDRVLVELANLMSGLRAGDRAYRIGGDEFALILPHTSASDARGVLERIRSAAPRALHGSTVSIGYSTVEGSDVTAEALQNQADAALYLTKRGGRNGVSQFLESNKATWLLSTERVQGLRALLSAGAIPIAFQPIWDLQHAKVLAFEALLRPAASFGFAGPQDAFDLAERIGCAHELDRASWMSALQRADELPARALLFLNISPQTLDRDFDVAGFTSSVAACGLRPERIVIEITERSIAHIDNVIAVAQSLRRAGFGIALDDTGAGHAGLEIMSRLHFDYVKIDRAIIVQAMSDRNASGVVAAIVAFAQVTGAYVIAEGIEDLAMLGFVDQAGRERAPGGRGIRGGQGYLLNRPSQTLPTESEIRSVTALLNEHVTRESAKDRHVA
ncbi:MAG: hypothetical protein JWO66_33 [Candidatus Eremiobacteraeota bacterium]|nr:hypothetical protein [Candidatus Eremiobacteraeota bacterium]